TAWGGWRARGSLLSGDAAYMSPFAERVSQGGAAEHVRPGARRPSRQVTPSEAHLPQGVRGRNAPCVGGRKNCPRTAPPRTRGQQPVPLRTLDVRQIRRGLLGKRKASGMESNPVILWGQAGIGHRLGTARVPSQAEAARRGAVCRRAGAEVKAVHTRSSALWAARRGP